MKVCRLLAVLSLGLLILTVSCETEKPKPLAAINNSDVYRLAQEAIQPVADKCINKGDRVLLLKVDDCYGTRAWRFVPVPEEIPDKDWDAKISPAVSRLTPASANVGGTERESKLLSDAFDHDATKKIHRLKTSSDAYDELILGRILAEGGYSGIDAFSLEDYAARNPYFIDAFESGLLDAMMKKEGTGIERVALADLDAASMEGHKKGAIVFGTNMLKFNTWKDLKDKFWPPNKDQAPAQVSKDTAPKTQPAANTAPKPLPSRGAGWKLLVYSVNNVVDSGMDYIGIEATFKLIDIGNCGKILWEGSKTMTSADFPRDKTPSLGGLRLTLPQSALDKRGSFAQKLSGQLASPATAILTKIDDISVFGTYPVTKEDFAVEEALQGFFAQLPDFTIVEKLPKRQYKEPWQLANAVHYVNPVLAGDYRALPDFYGARYMVGYRILWKKLQGVQLLQGQSDLELADKILGIYVKVIDMGDGGKTLLSDFLPFVSDSDLGKNILYRCYAATRGLSKVADFLGEKGVADDNTPAVLVNRRMEIANLYLERKPEEGKDTVEETQTEKFIRTRMHPGDVPAIFRSYYDVYEVIRSLALPASEKPKPVLTTSGKNEEPPFDQYQEMYLCMAANLMQSWFEDGLCSALTAAKLVPEEKFESLYSRYALHSQVGHTDRLSGLPNSGKQDQRVSSAWTPPAVLPYLSPIALARWGQTVKSIYNIDKIVYFTLLETKKPTQYFLETPQTVPLARFFPFVTSEPDSLQLSVVNVVTGDYELKKDFALK